MLPVRETVFLCQAPAGSALRTVTSEESAQEWEFSQMGTWCLCERFPNTCLYTLIYLVQY